MTVKTLSNIARKCYFCYNHADITYHVIGDYTHYGQYEKGEIHEISCNNCNRYRPSYAPDSVEKDEKKFIDWMQGRLNYCKETERWTMEVDKSPAARIERLIEAAEKQLDQSATSGGLDNCDTIARAKIALHAIRNR